MKNQYLLGHKVEVTDGKKIWYVAEFSGFLMEVDLASRELKCIWKIPDSMKTCDYRLLFYNEHKLYIFPFNQKTIYIYNLKTTKYIAVNVKKTPELMGCLKRGHFLYAFGNKSEIIKLDLCEKTIDYIDIRTKGLNFEMMPEYWFWTNSFVLNGNIYLPIQNSNILIILDEEDNVSSICLGEKQERRILSSIHLDYECYSTIYCKEKDGLLTTHIEEYDLNGKLLHEKHLLEKYVYQIYPFFHSIWVEKKWLCFPFGRNEILLRNQKHDELLFKVEGSTENLGDLVQGLFYCSVNTSEKILCSINQVTGYLVCINLMNWTIYYSPLRLKVDYRDLIVKGYQDGGIIKETKNLYDINSFIDFICK